MLENQDKNNYIIDNGVAFDQSLSETDLLREYILGLLKNQEYILNLIKKIDDKRTIHTKIRRLYRRRQDVSCCRRHSRSGSRPHKLSS